MCAAPQTCLLYISRDAWRATRLSVLQVQAAGMRGQRAPQILGQIVCSQIVGRLRGATVRVVRQLSISSLQLAGPTCTSCNKSVLCMQYSWFREVVCRMVVCNERCAKLCNDNSHLCLTFPDAGANVVVFPHIYI